MGQGHFSALRLSRLGGREQGPGSRGRAAGRRVSFTRGCAPVTLRLWRLGCDGNTLSRQALLGGTWGGWGRARLAAGLGVAGARCSCLPMTGMAMRAVLCGESPAAGEGCGRRRLGLRTWRSWRGTATCQGEDAGQGDCSLHARGWTPRPGGGRWLQLPAPCTRGGGPAGRRGVTYPQLCSLHARGWTLRAGRQHGSHRLLPARAGVDPAGGRGGGSPGAAPCTRGGGPGSAVPSPSPSTCSLHARGWTHHSGDDDGHGCLLPARAKASFPGSSALATRSLAHGRP